MNKTDSIARDSKILIDSVRDSITNNLLASSKPGELEVNEIQLSKILTIVNVSVDEGYQKALGVFQNMIKKHTGE